MEQMSKDIGRRLTLGMNSRNCLQLRNDLHVTIKRPHSNVRTAAYNSVFSQEEAINLRVKFTKKVTFLGGLAQLVERLLCKQNVIGSNPVTSTIFT